MTRRIFGAVLFIVVMTFIVFFTLNLRITFDYLSEYKVEEMREQMKMLTEGMHHGDVEYLEHLDTNTHIIYISDSGKVLFDNMNEDNVGKDGTKDAVVRQAQQRGFGYAEDRNDGMFGTAFHMAEKIDSGGILMLSEPQRSMFTIMMGMVQPILIVLGLVLAIVLDYAFQMSRDIVLPLNELDLDHPLDNQQYKEISPLLTRIDSQQKELRIKESELERRRREFETIVSSLNEGLLLLKTDGEIIAGNRFALRMFSEQEDSIGEKLQDLADDPVITKMIERACLGHKQEYIMERQGAHYQLAADPVVNDDNEVIGIAYTILNVTEKEAAERMRREFTANVSHELKTPLHTIAGSAELLSAGIVKEEDKSDFYQRIYSEAKRMITLVEDIMNVSESDLSTVTTFEPIDVYAVAEKCINTLEDVTLSERNIQIRLDGKPVQALGNKKMVMSVITNLLSNATKYNKDNGFIDVKVFDTNHYAVIEVTDTGVGIPLDEQDRIFERFYRVDKSRSKEAGGTGLGLAIVKNQVQQMNGTIELESSPGNGSTFRVSLPKYDEKK